LARTTKRKIELTPDRIIQFYAKKMGGMSDAQLGMWLRPTEDERREILAFLDAELTRREAMEKQPRPADTLRPYRLSNAQLARLKTHREAA
jgi:hypothetical protein